MDTSLYIDLPKTHYIPGEFIRGQILWALDEAPGQLELTLGWWTEGRGTKDSAIVFRQEWRASTSAGKEIFEIELPKAPYSFEGHLISLKWAIELRAPKGAENTVLDLQISPTPQAVELPFIENESKRKSFPFGIRR